VDSSAGGRRTAGVEYRLSGIAEIGLPWFARHLTSPMLASSYDAGPVTHLAGTPFDKLRANCMVEGLGERCRRSP